MSLPSHSQVCELVARCLPERVYAERFRAAFLRHPYDDDSPSAHSGGRLCRTPIDRLEKALAFVFPDRDVHSSLVINPGEISPGGHNIFSKNDPEQRCMFRGEWLQFFVMDCVLDRQLRRSRDPVGTLTPVKVQAFSKDDMLPSSDDRFRSAVAIVPDIGLFYCVRDRYPPAAATGGVSTGGGNDGGGVACDGGDHHGGRPFLPLELSWLRIRRHNAAWEPGEIGGTASSSSCDAAWFAAGGYARYVTVSEKTGFRNAWRFTVLRTRISATWLGPGVLRNVMTMFQRPDSFGTAMPPDVFQPRQLPDSAGEEDVVLCNRSRYDADLRASTSARLGARQYVRGALHSKIPDTALIIDPKVEGSFDLVIVLQKSSGDVVHQSARQRRPDSAPLLGVACESVVKVRYLRGDMDTNFVPALHQLVDLGERLRGRGKATARSNAGDDGFMYALGSRVDQSGKAVVDYKNNKLAGDCLPYAVASMRYLGLFAFPSVLRHAQEQERELGAIAIPCMESNRPFPKVQSFCNDVARVACTLDVSCDLANASHMDVNDAGPGFAVWTEMYPGSAKNWYFVLPNVYGVDRRSEKTRQFAGVAIRLNHGVAISWDGRQVRHCTSVTDVGRDDNHVFGVFSAPKVKLVDHSVKKRDEVLLVPATTGDGDNNPSLDEMAMVGENSTILPGGDGVGHGVPDLQHGIPIPRKRRVPYSGCCVAGTCSELLHCCCMASSVSDNSQSPPDDRATKLPCVSRSHGAPW